MSRRGSYVVFFSALSIFVLGLAIVYGISGRGLMMRKPHTALKEPAKIIKPVIDQDTVIRKEIRYLCGDKVSGIIPTTSDLIGLDFSGLVKKYPLQAGWNIDDTVKNTLLLARLEKRVCPYHQDFRHLGISDGYLAVFEGPLGYDQKLLQREDIRLNGLPPETQTGLIMAMDYSDQNPDTQGILKASCEFESETQLNAALENFDEFKE